jgi:hypothetical protein
MGENLYSPPKAVLADVAPTNDAGVRFFATSPVKLVVLSTCTLGLYQVYWFYKHWALIREHSEPDITPWARALFGILWCYSCFEFVRMDEQHLKIESTLTPAPFAIGWIAASLSWQLPQPYFLIGFLAPFVLIPVQRHINRINILVAPDHDKNTRFSAWNWLAVALGGIYVALMMFGLAHPIKQS